MPTSVTARTFPDNSIRVVFVAIATIVFSLAFHRRFWLGEQQLHFMAAHTGKLTQTSPDAHDPFKCIALLNEGQFLDALEAKPWRRPWQMWQPPGCLLHEYKAEDLGHCAGSRQMIFVGDSTVRQLFWAVAKKLNYDDVFEANKRSDKHGDVQFDQRGVDLRFIWDPSLNGSILANELQLYQDRIASLSGAKKESQDENPAVMIVIGGGLWHARHFEVDAVRQFKSALDSIITFTQRPDGSAWKSAAPFTGPEGIGDQVFFMPIEEPIYERLSPSRQISILPQVIDQMNDYLHRLTPSHGLNIPWVFPVMTAPRKKWTMEESGLHTIESIANRRADILLNLRCNAKVDQAVGTPYERTCCSNYTSGNWLQWVLIVFAIVLLPLATWWTASRRSATSASPISSLAASLAVIAALLCYCFFADRTQLFNKVHKLYSRSEFLSLCSFSLFFGLLTIRKSKNGLERKSSNELFVQSSQSFLSRDQTDEWKGWMQIIILFYNWTGASKELWIYIVVRILVASYLFLTGYGHAMYFAERGDYSARRVAAVLIRLNLLTVALSYQMYTSYLFYYVAPLASFWFLILFVTFRFGRELNDNLGFMLGKLAFSATITALVHTQAQPLDNLFRILRATCGINWDGNEWRFRVSLDCIIVYVGVLVALLHIWIRMVQSSPKLRR
jgi:hypothetical protein